MRNGVTVPIMMGKMNLELTSAWNKFPDYRETDRINYFREREGESGFRTDTI